LAVELKADRVAERQVQKRSSRPGTLTSRMGSAQAEVIAGERKAVVSGQSHAEPVRGVSGGIDPVTGKSGDRGVCRQGARQFWMSCSVPGMPVANRAGIDFGG